MSALLRLRWIVFVKCSENSNGAAIQPKVENTSKRFLFLTDAETPFLVFLQLPLEAPSPVSHFRGCSGNSGLCAASVTCCAGSRNLRLNGTVRSQARTGRTWLPSTHSVLGDLRTWVSCIFWCQPSIVVTGRPARVTGPSVYTEMILGRLSQ